MILTNFPLSYTHSLNGLKVRENRKGERLKTGFIKLSAINNYEILLAAEYDILEQYNPKFKVSEI